MRLVMAVSADGYAARSAADDMMWLGPHDKAAFKLLTLTPEVRLLGVSWRSAQSMPPELPGRGLLVLSRSRRTYTVAGRERAVDCSLEHFAGMSGGRVTLLGGPALAKEAKRQGLIDSVVLCRSDRRIFGGIEWPQELLRGLVCRRPVVKVVDTQVEFWDPQP